MARRELTHLARADQEHGATRQAVEDLLGQLDRGERDRHGVAADVGLRADLLGDRERVREQRVQRRPDGLARLRQREGVLHLTEDLRLADHHRIETGGHAEGVADRIPIDVRVEARVDRGRIQAALVTQVPEHGGARFARYLGDAVDLHAIAGRDDHRFGHPTLDQHLAQDFAELVLFEGELLADGNRGRPMVHAGDEEAHQEPCRPGSRNPAPSVSTSAAKPMIAK